MPVSAAQTRRSDLFRSSAVRQEHAVRYSSSITACGERQAALAQNNNNRKRCYSESERKVEEWRASVDSQINGVPLYVPTILQPGAGFRVLNMLGLFTPPH